MDHLLSLLKRFSLPDLTPGYVREFHEEVMRASADGKLTEEEIAHLEARREELGLSDEALAAVRLHVYAEAFKNVKKDERVTDDEWEELEQIQDYLNLADKDIARTKKELYRLRILTELRDGNMPITTTTELLTEPQEVVHWVEKMTIYEQVPSNKHNQWKKEGNGTLFITRTRVVVTGPSATRSHTYASLVHVDCDRKGITLYANRRRPLRLEYRDSDNRDVVASILLAAIEYAKA